MKYYPVRNLKRLSLLSGSAYVYVSVQRNTNPDVDSTDRGICIYSCSGF